MFLCGLLSSISLMFCISIFLFFYQPFFTFYMPKLVLFCLSINLLLLHWTLITSLLSILPDLTSSTQKGLWDWLVNTKEIHLLIMGTIGWSYQFYVKTQLEQPWKRTSRCLWRDIHQGSTIYFTLYKYMLKLIVYLFICLLLGGVLQSQVHWCRCHKNWYLPRSPG